MLHTLAITWPGPFEMMLLAGLGLLIFGKRLPEVGRSLGKGIVEFKKGLKGVEEEVETQSNPKPNPPAQITGQTSSAQALPSQPAPAAASQFKFDPYTGKPIENTTTTSSQA